MLYALIDANNFYVSCERAFNPKLTGKPVIVLSNNDGCVIARSNEVKQLGIPMGTPYFKIRTQCQRHNISVYSSNYAFYGDMSRRMVAIIKQFEPRVECYSIDEVFLVFKMRKQDAKAYFMQLRQAILAATGIPVAIGVGRTKTLAKVASFQAKKVLGTSICILNHCLSERCALHTTPIGEVWGVGRCWAERLRQSSLKTALALSVQAPHVIRRGYGLGLANTVRELQGTPCFPLTFTSPVKKTIMSSKSFGQGIRSYTAIAKALTCYTVRACEKLRAQHSLAQEITVFLKTSPFKTHQPHYSRSMSVSLPMATHDSGMIAHHAKVGLKQLYKPGLDYHKTGIALGQLISETAPEQLDLFESPERKRLSKRAQLMDAINAKFGKDTLRLGSQGLQGAWQRRCQYESPHYTTQWRDILRVNT